MVKSMTAFGSATGAKGPFTWVWEVRSVNGRGLDIRLRMPDGCEAMDQPVRKILGSVAKRGTLNVGLKLKRNAAEAEARLNEDALAHALDAAQAAKAAVEARGLTATPVDVAGLLSFPGVVARGEGDQDLSPFLADLTTSLQEAATAFETARAAEGAALLAVLTDQVNQIADLVALARTALPDRSAKAAEAFRTNVAKILDTNDSLDEARIAQELAILAVKSDVAEELDRLDAHITAARELLTVKGPIGRKFDFLTQEFNREANTLCSKSGHESLTRIGLDLKTVIDQMREQVQNVE